MVMGKMSWCWCFDFFNIFIVVYSISKNQKYKPRGSEIRGNQRSLLQKKVGDILYVENCIYDAPQSIRWFNDIIIIVGYILFLDLL